MKHETINGIDCQFDADGKLAYMSEDGKACWKQAWELYWMGNLKAIFHGAATYGDVTFYHSSAPHGHYSARVAQVLPA